MHLAHWYVVLVCHQYDVCENYVGSVYVGGYDGLSESGLCIFCKLCPVSFLVVVVNVMLSLMSVMSPPPALCNISVRAAVKLCILCVLALGVSLVS